MQKRNLEVCLTPALLHLHVFTQSIVVVIDIFRATSSICYGIENGAESIIPVATIEACESYRHSEYLLAAERNGEVVDGFDFGNSPFSYTEDKVSGKTIVLTTTNGTHAINMSRGAHKIVIGSFLNLAALCDWLKAQPNDVLLLCSGWKDKVNLEDTLFAGGVVHYLREENYALDDAGIASEDLYIMAKDDLNTYLKKTSHSERLKKLGIEEDIKFCLNLNITKGIPVLDGERLVKMII
ncbi:MAG: 2-phosphosulfolactate phosphatase [Sphingobacteriales bacterium 17-39-43]|uniref:2-phosphosulfolactate phosphatase n=1 Tax=Daejeonella sp. TaxID=2805397 RepID=UPI000BD8F5B0|nr:2-phosphosulfolactate phosphatase [Daejeonella sp.]OYZ31741.1 MAG: 2-phosphosulfolactate phosphatase [Sphingobacteriales bacterium 16-39-50]OYZ56429.1 MAG: 2-phosphosulfolactate phosphatase [Sphingobacteriales bacterium 24-40-4]OZA25138.1 MAG: 2-phosphosulfolactate phosphatase [Sphingobacteriales bacterium 17-39-43]HQS04571.1 2-phosphosulfolactate phosphatase [Daejeonella sp.]HQT22869.1 2-phosphosulfolactate phosphatase [Daejeonella sp.]